MGLLVGPPLIAAFTMLLQRAGSWLVPAAVVFMMALQIFALLLFPVISGWFNKFVPLPQNELR